MKIALIQERKIPADRRVAITPEQCQELMRKYPELTIVAESSHDRIFDDNAYAKAGVEVVTDVTDCDLLMGIKEVPEASLIPEKTYTFFSHTIKKQPYNKEMLRAIVRKRIRLIDYECLDWPSGGRILGFGHWAGVVGTYNAFLTYGKKYNSFHLKPAYECTDYDDLKQQLTAIKNQIPNIRIGLTGSGRVAHGALEVLRFMEIEELSVPDFLHPDNLSNTRPVFVNFKDEHIYKRRQPGLPWDNKHFFANHGDYEGNFNRFLSCTDVLINGFYWEPSLPSLFTKADTALSNFRIRVIADITCDVEGSIPITLRATYPLDPTFGWDGKNQKEVDPFGENSIDVMAVTVLPSELPADASRDFGQSISNDIIPHFLNGDKEEILKNATLTEEGALTDKYAYLKDYIS